MNPELQLQISELAQSLGTTAEYLWGVLISQAPIHGVSMLIATLLFWAVVFLIVTFAKKYYKMTNEAGLDGDDIGFMFFLGLTIALVIAISLTTLHSSITAFFNPEFFALDHILDRIGRSE